MDSVITNEKLTTVELPAPPPNPWKTLDSRVVYENPWISVREDRVVQPGGTEGIYGIVTQKVATGVLAIDDDDRVVLVGQWRYGFGMYSWEMPEGGVDTDDSLACCKRELAEEAGLDADTWTPLLTGVQLSNSTTTEVADIFLATGLSPRDGGQDLDDTEQIQVARVPFNDVVTMCLDGRIVDAMTIMAVLAHDRARR